MTDQPRTAFEAATAACTKPFPWQGRYRYKTRPAGARGPLRMSRAFLTMKEALEHSAEFRIERALDTFGDAVTEQIRLKVKMAWYGRRHQGWSWADAIHWLMKEFATASGDVMARGSAAVDDAIARQMAASIERRERP